MRSVEAADDIAAVVDDHIHIGLDFATATADVLGSAHQLTLSAPMFVKCLLGKIWTRYSNSIAVVASPSSAKFATMIRIQRTCI